MRILIVSSFAPSLVNFRKDLIKSLIGGNNEIFCAAPDFNFYQDVKKELFELGADLVQIKLNRQGLNPLQDFISFFSLLNKLNKIKPDLVIAYTIKPVIYSGLAIRFQNLFLRKEVKYFPLITGLGFAFTKSERTFLRRLVSIIIREFLKVSLKYATKIIFQNRDDKKFFYENSIILKQNKTHIVNGSGVNLEVYPEKKMPNNLIFLMIARLNEDKGVREYLAAAEMIKSKYPEVKFELAGGFDNYPYSINKEEIKMHIEKGTINYLGELQSVQNALERCKVFVLPSYREGTPRTVLEAMATGRPILTTDVPGCRETVLNGYNGFLVKHNDIKSLFSGMLKILNCSKKQLSIMGKNSNKIAKEKFDVHDVNRKLIDIFFERI